MTKNQNQSQMLYTLAGYFLIFLILVVAAFVLGGMLYYLVIGTGALPSHDSIVKWTGLIMFTPMIFGYVIKHGRPHWHTGAFWITNAGLLALHIACFLVLFRFVHDWRMFWFCVICTLETPLIESLADRIVSHIRRRPQGL